MRKKIVDIYEYTDAVSYISKCKKKKIYPWTISYGKMSAIIGVVKSHIWATSIGRKTFPPIVVKFLVESSGLSKKEKLYYEALLYFSKREINPKLRNYIISKLRPAKYKKQVEK